MLVCLDTLAACSSRVWADSQCGRATTAVLDILTISVQRFDAQPALDVHEVSSRVFGTLTISVPPLVEPPGSINASIALICEAGAIAA